MPKSRSTGIAVGISLLLFLGAGNGMAEDLRGHGGPVRALAVDGDRVVSGSFDTRAIVWTGVTASQVTRAHSGAVTAVLPLPDGSFASGGQDGHIAIWGSDAAPLRFERWHEMPVADLAVWGNGIASGSWNGQIALWDGTTPPRYLEGHEGQVTAISAYGDGLASVGSDLRLRLWMADGSSGSVIDLPAPPSDLAVVDDAIFIVGADGFLRRIIPGQGQRDVELSLRPLLAVTSGGGQLAVSDISGSVWLIDPVSLSIRRKITTDQGAVWALALNDDGLWTGGNDGWIRRWTPQGEPLGTGSGALEEIPANDRGAEVFRACAVCHTVTPDDGQRAGPTLYRIFGRPIATAPGYDYSEALSGMNIIWTPETVSALFEYGPEAYTPGSRMPEQRVPSAEDRAALMRYLEEATQ